VTTEEDVDMSLKEIIRIANREKVRR
jgi:hypothetical protein